MERELKRGWVVRGDEGGDSSSYLALLNKAAEEVGEKRRGK